jgi:Uma2 family endonuclease
MTTTALPIPLADQQHIVMHDVSWDFYTRVLEQIGDGTTRVTFSDGSIEIMSPLPEHEAAKESIGVLIDVLAADRRMTIARFGSTTFRREDRQKGLEPDKCYYFGKSVARVRGMKRFDPTVHPVPDLAVEIDITRRSIVRQPIYATLGVREIWRFDGHRLVALLLKRGGTYAASRSSRVFPFLPMDRFEAFVLRMASEDQMTVQLEFQDWVRTLPR